jgi:hypothetical protein
MSQAAPIVINDGASTPVAHTFTPLGKDDKGVFYWEQTNPVPGSVIAAKKIGYRQVRELNAQKQATGKSKVTITIQLPTAETLANNSAGIVPPPTLAYVEDVRVEFTLPERGLKQERKDTRALIMNLLANALFVSAIDDLQPIYA